jgi:hypothetical protein
VLEELPATKTPGIPLLVVFFIGADSDNVDPPVVLRVPDMMIVTPVPEMTDCAPPEMSPLTM